MLRSSGYFERLVCPFTGIPGAVGCQRPHCQFRHGEEEKAHGNDEEASEAELENDMEELHRINKAIQDVKTEVEEEQKKLLLYMHKPKSPVALSAPIIDLNQNYSTGSSSEPPISVEDKPDVISISKSQNKICVSISDKKYIIDRRCPATDLEYDPLLNYSASLLCSSSRASGNGTSRLKRKSATNEDSIASPNKELDSSSPIKLEIKLQESDEDDLVIDVPPLQPVFKKPRMMKKESSLQTGEIDKYLHSNDSDFDDNGEKQVGLVKNEVDEIVPSSLPNGYINQHEMEKKQVPDQESKLFTQESDQNVSVSLTEGSAFSTPPGVGIPVEKEKSKTEESKKCLRQNETHPLMAEMQDNCFLYPVKHLKADVFEEMQNEKPMHVEDCPKPDLPLVPVLQNNENVLNITSSSIVQSNQAMCIDISSPQDVIKADHCKKSIQESEIIVVDSSSEEYSDHSEEDIDISESDDPMEECLRIFNEFAESQLKESAEQIIVEEDNELNTSDSKAEELVNASKKRIAHPAKCDAKSNKEVFMPLREPFLQPASNVRILQAQQQAVQITAAVKSGQEFVTATASRRVIRSVMPTEVHRIGKIVYLNMVEHQQPAVLTRIPINSMLQKKKFGTLPCNSTIPVKKISQPSSAKVSVTRRRPSVVPEPGSKVPHEMRQRYVNFFVEEYLKVCSTVHDAFDKALTEEKGIYDRCGSKNMYLNISVNTLKRLRDHRSLSSNNSSLGSTKSNSIGGKKDEKNDFTGDILYKVLTDYVLNEEQLKENGYPRTNPEKPGSVLLYNTLFKATAADSLRRVCCRCGETYAITSEGKHVRKEECNYHSGKVLRQRVPGGLETRYSCCEAVVGTPGCQVAKFHVHDGQKDNMDGFMTTFKKPPPVDGNPGVFAVDCEMCYTTQGLNLTRVTVVDHNLQVIYDTFVKPDYQIVDFNTRFSGVSEDDLKNVTTNIRDVQAIMLNLFSAETILIGHSLECDLFAIKLIHDKVVDTSVVFPHRLGLPHKRALRNLTADYLRRIIQDDVGGHDSREDASACMELMIWKVREDTKGRRW